MVLYPRNYRYRNYRNYAKPDDYKTDPSGDSGDRIACAVLAAGK